MPPSGPGSPPRSLARFGCVRCREHHLKCDRATPACGRCANAGESCYQPGLKIREKKFKFTRTQKWARTPRRLVFIDESQTAANDVSSPDSGPDELEADYVPSPVTQDGISQQAGLPHPHSSRPPSPPARIRLMMISSVLDSPPPLDPPNWPLEDPDEARLFRHFVQKLAIWLDLCDPSLTFESTVPQRARDCSILRNAMFALSARHLSQTCRDGRKWHYHELAGKYNYACIKLINRLLENPRYQSWTEHLFAAAIILQVMEEMNAALPVDGIAVDQGHLPGMYRFVETKSLQPGSLAAASFWVALRQEIYSAVTRRQPVRLNLDHPELVDRSLEPADDYIWANRAVVHCADVLNFCFDSERRQLGQWEELDQWNRVWSERQPPSYDPIFRQHPDSAVFPEIWYHRSCQVIGVQHHLLAKLFLLDYRIRFGNRPTDDDKHGIQESIRQAVREICGIGCGNQWTPPGTFTACMAISAFGSYFGKVEEQDAMLAILEETERDHARPTESVILDLLQVWGRYALLAKRMRQKHRMMTRD